MPIEIREIIIRTEVNTHSLRKYDARDDKEIALLKRQLLDACRVMVLKESAKKDGLKR